MTGSNFHEVVELICKEDDRYAAGAYEFVRMGLDFTLDRIRRKEESLRSRHITGKELSEGLRDFALEQYGPMAFTLVDTHGIRSTEDFGNIVFNLVEYGVFGKTESDRREDFENLFDLKAALQKPFLPKKRYPAKGAKRGSKVASESKSS